MLVKERDSSSEVAKYQHIVSSAIKCFMERGYREIDISYKELAAVCGIRESEFCKYYAERWQILLDVIADAALCCERELFLKIKNTKHQNNYRILHFITCVDDFLESHPEAGFLFSLSSTAEVVLSPAYKALISYFDRWQNILTQYLLQDLPFDTATRVSEVYVATLKGGFLESDLSVGHMMAREFLMEVVKCCSLVV